MRPLDQLLQDAEKAVSEGQDHLLIRRNELRQLKDYRMVTGTADPDVALLSVPTPDAGVTVQLQLLVKDVLP